jgi:hypothetical protein
VARRKHTRSCRGKRRYHDHAEAVRILHALKAKSTRQKIATRAYYCATCNGFHITSQAYRPTQH